MAVSLLSTIREYQGLSTDTKPASTADDTLPNGSTFYELDTGRKWYWDAPGLTTSSTGAQGRWVYPTVARFDLEAERTHQLLDSIDTRIAKLLKLLERKL